jgi:hypothetical protein
MRFRSVAQVLKMALVGLLCTCRGCPERGPAHILDLPSADCRGLLLVPAVEGLATGIEGFTTRATEEAGRQAVTRLRAGLTQQLGFDPLDPATHTTAGIDAKAPALIFTEAYHREPILALGVSNRDRFDAALRAMIARTDGANQHTTTEQHGRRVHALGRPFGTEVVPVVRWSHVGRFALLARASGAPALDAVLERLGGGRDRGQKRPQAGTLRADPDYQHVRSKVLGARLHPRGAFRRQQGRALPSRGGSLALDEVYRVVD